MGRAVFLLWLAAVACGPSYEEKELARAVRKRKVEAVRAFLRYSLSADEEVKAEARRAIERLRSDARTEMRKRIPADRREARAFAEALLSWLAAHDSEAVVVSAADPDVTLLRENDAVMAAVDPAPSPPDGGAWSLSQPPPRSAGIAPAAPAFAGASSFSIQRALDASLGRVFPFGVVRAVEPRDVERGEHPTIEVVYTVEPTARIFHLPTVRRDLVGVVLRFDVTMRVPGGPELSFHHEGEPPETFTATVDHLAVAIDSTSWGAGTTDSDAYRGMADAIIEGLGGRLQEVLTGAGPARPPAMPRAQIREELCRQGDEDACIEIARSLGSSPKIEDQQRAVELLDPLCLLRHRPEVCAELAWLRLRAPAPLHDADKASSTAYGGCEAGDAASCLLRGQIYARDPEVARFLTGPGMQFVRASTEEARRSFQRACALGSAEGCARVAPGAAGDGGAGR